jgi:hypothetical protein
MRWLLGASLLLLLLLAPVAYTAVRQGAGAAEHWSTARWDSAGLAPDPATHHEALVQVYAARAYAWRGAFSVHSWIAMKARDANAYARYEVLGWGVARGLPAVRRNRHAVDGYWAGNQPRVVAELRGAQAEAAIPKLEAAIERYPHGEHYLTWPGPNSNSFIAYLAREVPELELEMPANAVGKDYLVGRTLVAPAPSGSGWQVSLYGLAGLLLARDEGLEINLLGLVIGVDPADLAIKLPGIGRVGLAG